jgi:hypothetical protein
VGADEDSGGDDGVSPQRNVARKVGRRVNRIDKLEAPGRKLIGEGPADAVVADRYDRSVHAEPGSQCRQIIGMAQHFQAIDAPPVRCGVGVDKPYGIKSPGPTEDVEDDAPVPAAAYDEASAWFIIWSYGCCGRSHIENTDLRKVQCDPQSGVCAATPFSVSVRPG